MKDSEKLIKERLENWDKPYNSSIEYYAETGKVSGSLFIAIEKNDE